MESKDDFYRALDSYIPKEKHPFLLEELKFVGDDLGSPEVYFAVYGPIRTEFEFVNFCDAVVHVLRIKGTISMEKYGKHKFFFPIFILHKLSMVLDTLRIYSGPTVTRMHMAVLELMEMFPDAKLLLENARGIKDSWPINTFVYNQWLKKIEDPDVPYSVVERAMVAYMKGTLSRTVDIEKVVRFRPFAYTYLLVDVYDPQGPDVFARYCTLVNLVLQDMPPLDELVGGQVLVLSLLRQLVKMYDFHNGDMDLALRTMDRIIGSPYMTNETFVKIEPFLRTLPWSEKMSKLVRRASEKFFKAPKRSKELLWLLNATEDSGDGDGDSDSDSGGAESSFFARHFL